MYNKPNKNKKYNKYLNVVYYMTLTNKTTMSLPTRDFHSFPSNPTHKRAIFPLHLTKAFPKIVSKVKVLRQRKAHNENRMNGKSSGKLIFWNFDQLDWIKSCAFLYCFQDTLSQKPSPFESSMSHSCNLNTWLKTSVEWRGGGGGRF